MGGVSDTSTDPGSPFDDLDRFVAVPRVAGLALSPAGDRLVTTVAELDKDGARYVSGLWALDPAGVAPARRLTRSDKGESSPRFASDGSLLFLSGRPRPEDPADDPAGLWVLPAAGGEPWPVATSPGGITAFDAARDAPVVVFSAPVAPAGHRPDEAAWRKARTTRKITAILHEEVPVRQWDHERGPEEDHLFVGTRGDGGDPAGLTDVRDLTPDAGRALHEATPSLTPDGLQVIVTWEVPLGRGRLRTDVVAIDVATGARTPLASHPEGAWSYSGPAVSPDSRRVVCLRESRVTTEEPWGLEVWLVDLPGSESPGGAGSPDGSESPEGAGSPDGAGAGRVLDIGGDLWPAGVRWSANGTEVIVTGDLGGHHPLLAVDPATGATRRLTGPGAYSSATPAPDGSLFALRSSVAGPPRPVRLEPAGADPAGADPAGADPAGADPAPWSVTEIEAPGGLEAPGRLEEVTATAADGTPLRAWLVLPEGADAATPAPLVLWVHGGPVSSWNDWSWRWNPWLMAARGWAVLLPDPALSTGYGMGMIRRGWGQWGGNPYTDLMAVTDVAEARPDIDASRVAAMGGSYGGYMANWIAGHTDRFAAIVSHASIWSVEQFRATTDHPQTWTEEWGRPDERPEFYREWSPDTYVDAITTPLLIIHGNDDYRCPVSESVRLWTELVERGREAKFLSFPDENHWILRPGDATVWYGAVFAFLDHHVLGRPWERPALL
jgi:dipeptidyl aminopeptidase/acylaminoacyl peptidase